MPLLDESAARCLKPCAFDSHCAGPREGARNCSCVPCYSPPPPSESGLRGMHCCADNGATISHGGWRADAPGGESAAACRALCTRTAGCTHFSFSSAPNECADELRELSRGYGRCGLCGACTARATPAAWQASYVSHELAPAERHRVGGGKHHGSGGAARTHHNPRRDGVAGDDGAAAAALADGATAAAAPLPAVIVSGCDRRYERAAAVARRAGFAPTWLVGVFRHNIAVASPCVWPSASELNLLTAHRNAWSLIANGNVSMAVLEDDIELASSAAAIRRDVARCEASRRAPRAAAGGACELLYLGFVDAFWATHALWVSPPAARALLQQTSRACSEPTDYHTHRLCLGRPTERSGSWHVNRVLLPRCHAPAPHAAPAGASRRLSAAAPASAAPRSRAPELYGMGHFIQNRTRGYIHRLRGFKLVDGGAGGQGANC